MRRGTSWNELLEKSFTAEEIEEIKEEAAHEVRVSRSLRELRKMLKITQDDLADVIKTSQSRLSVVETSQDHLVSTVRRYIEGLGGSLELTAVFEGEEGEIIRIPLEEASG